MTFQAQCSHLRELIEKTVRKKCVDAMLFSAGLDTAILAYESAKFSKPMLITVIFETHGIDEIFALKLAQALNLNCHTVRLNKEKAYSIIPEVIQILKSFDPMEIRNSVPIYAGLKFAKEENAETVMTGDGGDELFFGYNLLT